MFWAGFPPSVTLYIYNIKPNNKIYPPPCCTSPFLHVRHTHAYWPTLTSFTLFTVSHPLGGAIVIGFCMYALYFQCTLCMFFPYGGETLPALGNLTAPSLFWAGYLFSCPYSPCPRRREKFPRAAWSRGPIPGLSLAAVRVPAWVLRSAAILLQSTAVQHLVLVLCLTAFISSVNLFPVFNW